MTVNRLSRQSGAALATALLFLVILTLLGIGALRESRVALRMAANDESRVNALEVSQSLVDALLADVELNFPVAAAADLQLGCFPAGTVAAAPPLRAPFSCDTASLTPPATPSAALSQQTYVEIFREAVNGEALISAASIGNTGTTARVRYARFRVTAGLDRTGRGLGAAEVEQGVQIGVPFIDGVNLF